MKRFAGLIALLAAVAVPPLAGGGVAAQSTGWTVTPQLGVAFHGNYYDDQVITTFAGEEGIEADFTEIDPGASVRVGGRVSYDFLPGVSFHGGVFGSWPDADVAVGAGADRRFQSDVDVRVLEFTGGATVQLGEVTASGLPLYVGGSVGLVNHSFDEIRWEDEFIDPTTTSLNVGARAGIEYPVVPRVSLRGEIRQTLVFGAYGDFEDEIAAVEARDEGVADASSDFESNTFSIFGLEAGLSIRL